MSTIINATTTNGVVIQPDNSGSLVLQTNSGTTALTIDTSQNVTLAGTVAMSSSFLRNRIINGDMRIDQRNAGAAVTANGAFPVDRFFMTNGTDGTFSAQQSTSIIPTGFTHSVGITITSADTSLTAAQALAYNQRIEGYNVADLGWGTANAQTVTLSFWVRSSLTGTFGGSLRNSAANRSYPFTYTISSANTWELKSVTIAGDTSGTWLTDSGTGIIATLALGAGPDRSGTAGAWNSNSNASATGAVSVVGTNGATWYITGVQLEVGSTATPFERRLYNQELANCQRYFISYGGDSVYNKAAYGGTANSSTIVVSFVSFPVQMRSAPSFGSTGSWTVSDGVTGTTVTALAVVANQTSSLIGMIQATVASGLTTYRAYWLESTNTTAAKISWSAEL